MTTGSKIAKRGFLAISILLAFCLIFTACGKQQNTSTPAAPTAKSVETAASVTPDDLPEVKLTWYFGGAWPWPDQDEVFAEVNKIIKSKINATVDFKPLNWGDYDQKMKVIIASGEAYDLAFTSNWTNNYTQNVAKGAFLPLDDLLSKYAPQAYASVPPAFWEATKVNGQIYGFINQQISARTPNIEIRESIANKYNLDMNALIGKLTSAEGLKLLEPFLAAVHKEEPDRILLTNLADFQESTQYEAIAGVSIPGGVSYDDDTLTVVNLFETPEFKGFAELMRDWNAKGYLGAKERISKKTDAGITSEVSISIGGAFKPGLTAIMTNKLGEPVIDIPAGTAHLSTSGIIATMMAISRTSKNPERAMMLLELMNTDKEVFNLLNFGIQDKHYKLDENGFRVVLDNKGYFPEMPWMFASNFLAHVDQGMPITVWEETKKLNEEALPSKLLGFNFDAEPVKAEIGKASAVYDEYYRSIELGVINEEKYNQFLAKLKDAGSDKIIAEMQKQIDTWKTTR